MILDRLYIAYTRRIIATAIIIIRFRQDVDDGNAHYQHPPKKLDKPKCLEDRLYCLQSIWI